MDKRLPTQGDSEQDGGADSGRVIGVVNMGLLKGNRETALSQPSGIAYAIPVRHALALLGGRQATVP